MAMTSLLDRLSAERQRRFVGRHFELQLFLQAIGSPQLPFHSAEADAWTPMLSYFDLMRLPEVDFQVGGRHYGVYGHDWRVVSPTAWRELLAKREVAADAEVEASTSVSQPMLVLSREDFVEGVQNALRNFTRADTLQNNPLMRSRIVYEQLAPDTAGESTSSKIRDRMTTLQTLLKQAAESLQSSPCDANYT
jgi:hypothetical protein